MKRTSSQRKRGVTPEGIVRSLQYAVTRVLEQNSKLLPIYLTPSSSCLQWHEISDSAEMLPSSVEPLTSLYENLYRSMADMRSASGTVCLSSLRYGAGVLQSLLSEHCRLSTGVMTHLVHSVMLEVTDGDVLSRSLALLRTSLELHPPKCRRIRLMYHEAICGSYPSALCTIERAVSLALNTPHHSDCWFARLHFVDWLVSVFEFDMAVWYTQCMSDSTSGSTAVSESLTNVSRRCLLARTVWLNDISLSPGHRTQSLCGLVAEAYKQCSGTGGSVASALVVFLHRLLYMTAECVRFFSQSDSSGPFSVSDAMLQLAMQLTRSFATLYDQWSQDELDTFLTQLRPHWLLVVVSATMLEWRHSRAHLTDFSLSAFIECFISDPPVFSSDSLINDRLTPIDSRSDALGSFRSPEIVMESGCSGDSSKLPPLEELSRADEDGNTWLHRVCSEGHCELLRHALFRFPALDTNLVNCRGRSPLHEACTSGHVGCVLLLLQPRTNDTEPHVLNASSRLLALDFAGHSPFHSAITANHVQVVSFLLRHADVRLRDQLLTRLTADDLSPLHLSKSRQMAELLVVVKSEGRISDDGTGVIARKTSQPNGSIECKWRYSMVTSRLLLGYITWLHLFDVRNFLTRRDLSLTPRLSTSLSPPDSLIIVFNRQLRKLMVTDGSLRHSLRAAIANGTLSPRIFLCLLTLLSC